MTNETSRTDQSDEVPPQLRREVVESIELLEVSGDVEQTAARITSVAQYILDGCDFCSISALANDKIRTIGATDVRAEAIDAIQYETHEGPCWVAATEQRRLVTTRNTSEDERWPNFSRRTASEVGVFSMMACRLVADNPPRALGAINFYGDTPDSFERTDQHVAIMLAAVVAVVVRAAERETELSEAILTRGLIGQAMGILMAQSNVTADEAFDQLRAASQRMNLKLRDLAKMIAESSGRQSG